MIDGSSGMDLLYHMKFFQAGRDPLEDRDLNIIEQLNQQFTYVTSLHAVKILLHEHNDLKPFTMNLGTADGYDIESDLGILKAEVFSSANPKNNQKLKNDVVRLFNSDAEIKIAFYHAPYQHTGEEKIMADYRGVQIKYISEL